MDLETAVAVARAWAAVACFTAVVNIASLVYFIREWKRLFKSHEEEIEAIHRRHNEKDEWWRRGPDAEE